VAVSPDGKFVAAGEDVGAGLNEIYLWDATTGALLRVFSGHTNAIRGLVFSADSQSLYSTADDNWLRTWEVATGKSLHSLPTEGHLHGLTLLSDGQTLVGGRENGSATFWDMATQTRAREQQGPPDETKFVTASLTGQELAFAEADRTIRLWDVPSAKQLRSLSSHRDEVSSLVFSPDGRTLASGSWDSSVLLWDVLSGAVKRSLVGHGDKVSSLAYSHDGRWLASGSADRTVRIWEVLPGPGRPLHVLSGQREAVTSVAFSQDAHLLAVTAGSNVYLWDLPQVEKLYRATAIDLVRESERRTLLHTNGTDTVEGVGMDTGNPLDIKPISQRGPQTPIPQRGPQTPILPRGPQPTPPVRPGMPARPLPGGPRTPFGGMPPPRPAPKP
jgi:WD40 repeat protein